MRNDAKRHVPGRFIRVLGTAHHVVVDEGAPAEEPLEAPVPTVLFTSGLGGAWYDWDAVVALLTAECGQPDRPALVRFDRPGLGWSEPAAAPPTVDVEAERIALLLDALDLPGPCVVVAHSMAAFHAEAFARLYPARTAGLVLVDASAEPDAIPPAGLEQRLRRARTVGAVLRATGTGAAISPAVRRLVTAATSVRRADPADPAQLSASTASGRPLAAALMENTVYLDQAAQLLELRCEKPFPPVPLTVLAALGAARVERRLVPGATLALKREGWRSRQLDLAALSPCGRLVGLPDSAHYIPFDRPDAVADAVLGILAEHDRLRRTR
jgi:pimeloyl-ACP methyl ester carboxylesterase